MKSFFAVLPVVGGLIWAGGLQAGSLLTPCATTPQTLAHYESNPCSIGILNFSNFNFTPSTTGTGPSDTSIFITPVAVGAGGGGFRYSGFSVLAGAMTDYRINYRFDIDPGPMVPLGDLDVDPPYGVFSIAQSYCMDSFVFVPPSGSVGCASATAGTFSAASANPTPQTLIVNNSKFHDQLAFNPAAMNFGTVSTDFDLDGRGQPLGSGFDSVTGTATVTPEPGTIALAFIALAATGVRRKRKSRI